jgi:hypothetical protein
LDDDFVRRDDGAVTGYFLICGRLFSCERHDGDLASGLIGDYEPPIFKPALIPDVIVQHIADDHRGVFSGLFVSREHIAIRIGNRPPPAHYYIEKVAWHSWKIAEQSNGCGTKPYRRPTIAEI